MAVFQKLLRAGEGKKTRALESLVPEVNAVEADYERLSDDELRAKTGDFKLEIDRGAARLAQPARGHVQESEGDL